MKSEALVEAILFTQGEPIAISLMADVLGLSHKDIRSALKTLEEKLNSGGGGLDIVVAGDKAQLVTKEGVAVIVQKLLKSELHDDLTSASKETLAIIGYL